MASARNNAPKAPMGVECGEEVPSTGEGFREKILIFEFKMASFLGASWELILLQLNCMSYTHKPVRLKKLWFVKPAIA